MSIVSAPAVPLNADECVVINPIDPSFESFEKHPQMWKIKTEETT